MVVEMEGLEDAGKVEVLDQEIPQYQAIQDLYNAYGGKGQFARVVCFANPGKPTEKGWFFVADGKVLHDNQNKVCGIWYQPMSFRLILGGQRQSLDKSTGPRIPSGEPEIPDNPEDDSQ